MEENLIVLDYKENFAENFSVYAYGKILSKISSNNCFYENNPKNREVFENKMKNFFLECNYISTSRVQEILRKKKSSNNKFLANIHSNIKNKKKYNGIVDLERFNVEDIQYLDEKILNDFRFRDLSFIQSYDILDDIKTTNSIGLYFSQNDIEQNNVDWDYINKAIARLNKYVKNPVLFIFSKIYVKNKIKFDIQTRLIDNLSKQEEFYFLTQTKHQIILNNSSYSFAFWSSVLNNKTYSIKVIKKTNKKQNLNLQNWIEV